MKTHRQLTDMDGNHWVLRRDAEAHAVEREKAARRKALEDAAKLVSRCGWGEYWSLDGDDVEPLHIVAAIRAMMENDDE